MLTLCVVHVIGLVISDLKSVLPINKTFAQKDQDASGPWHDAVFPGHLLPPLPAN